MNAIQIITKLGQLLLAVALTPSHCLHRPAFRHLMPTMAQYALRCSIVRSVYPSVFDSTGEPP